MTPIRRTCLPSFSFVHFIAWLLSPAHDSWVCNTIPRDDSSYGASATFNTQTSKSLSVEDNDMIYLTYGEAEQIVERFKGIPLSHDRLLFWTGISREWAQQWADDHAMITLTSAMGPLMDCTDQRCLRNVKTLGAWSEYVKGASGIFARYACSCGVVRVLTLPPFWAEMIRPESTYRTIEEPILKGASGSCYAVQINTVHLMTTCGELEYQTWPENLTPETLRCRSAGGFNFRLPRWTRNAVKAATKSVRSRVVDVMPSSTSKPADASVVLQVSVRRAGEPQTAHQVKSGKQRESNANERGHPQVQSQQPLSKKKQSQQEQQPQNQQSQSPRPQGKKKQSQSQQQEIKKKQQPQGQQPHSHKKQPQGQKSQSKKQIPRSDQSRNSR